MGVDLLGPGSARNYSVSLMMLCLIVEKNGGKWEEGSAGQASLSVYSEDQMRD
jgi:hypothetical protein